MKKLVSLLLVLALCLGCTSAFAEDVPTAALEGTVAEGKMNVVQMNGYRITDNAMNTNHFYGCAKVENCSGEPIKIEDCTLEALDADGKVIDSSKGYNFIQYLQPGEYTYVSSSYVKLEGDAVPAKMALTLNSSPDVECKYNYFPVESGLQIRGDVCVFFP